MASVRRRTVTILSNVVCVSSETPTTSQSTVVRPSRRTSSVGPLACARASLRSFPVLDGRNSRRERRGRKPGAVHSAPRPFHHGIRGSGGREAVQARGSPQVRSPPPILVRATRLAHLSLDHLGDRSEHSYTASQLRPPWRSSTAKRSVAAILGMAAWVGR